MAVNDDWLSSRSLDDIMEDYGGSEEWTTLLEKKDGKVVRFKTTLEGRDYFCTDYIPEFGALDMPDDAKKPCRGKP